MHDLSNPTTLVEVSPSNDNTPSYVDNAADYALSQLNERPHPNLSLFNFPSHPKFTSSSTTSPPKNASNNMSQLQCVVCQDELKSVVLLPCRHLCLCLECSITVTRKGKCPLCRSAIETALSVFIWLFIAMVPLPMIGKIHQQFCLFCSFSSIQILKHLLQFKSFRKVIQIFGLVVFVYCDSTQI